MASLLGQVCWGRSAKVAVNGLGRMRMTALAWEWRCRKNHGTFFLAGSSMTQLSWPRFSAVRDPPVAGRAELQSRLASYPAT